MFSFLYYTIKTKDISKSVWPALPLLFIPKSLY